MPVTIKTNVMKYKSSQGEYKEINAVSDHTAAEQIALIQSTGAAQVQAVGSAGTTQVGNVNSAGSTQITNINNRATEIENSWPSDYSELTDDVDSLKSAINFQSDMIGAKEIEFTKGGYVFTYYDAGSTVSLTPTANANFAYTIMECTEGDIIHINGKGEGNAFLWSFIDSSDKMIEKSASGLTGNNLVVVAPENAAKVILNSTVADLGVCFKGTIIKDDVASLQTTVNNIKSSRLMQQSDLVVANSNFVVKDGKAYAVSVVSPYNCMAINSKRIDFQYRRRNANYSLIVGVMIDGKFVGNGTNVVNSVLKKIDGTTNVTYDSGSVNVSVADNNYGMDYNNYTATIVGQVFELKKGDITIFKFTIDDGIEIQGIAFLNYYFTYYSTTDNTDFKNGFIVIDTVEEKSLVLEQEIEKKYEKPSDGIPDSDLKEQYLKEPSLIEFTTGYYIYTAGTVGTTVIDISTAKMSNANFSYAYIDVNPGDKFTINATGVQNAYLWAFLDSNNVMIDRSVGNLTGTNLLITAPENATKLIINSTNDGLGYCYAGETLDSKISKVDLVGNGKQHRMVAGVIRNSGNGWEFIVDSGHSGDMNCVSVSANASGQIVINYSGIGAKKTIALLITPDETFASAGYLCGSSVGSSAAYVEVYKYVPISVSGLVTCNNDGTIEIDSVLSVGINSVTWDSETKRMHIVHDNVDAKSCPIVLPSTYSATIPRIYSSSGNSVDLQFFNISDGSMATEVSNKLSFRFQRTSPTQLKLVKQDANNIVSAIGNFWFMGIFEM